MHLFGYIRPLDAQLRVCEFEEYRAVYCGFCRALGKRFGAFARATLSYDFTFVTMLAISLGDTAPTYSKQRCPFFPVKKRQHLDMCAQLETVCDMAVPVLRESCRDHIADGHFPKTLLWRSVMPILVAASDKAAGRHPEFDSICRDMTVRQAAAEKNPDVSVDLACDATATALGALLRTLSDKDSERMILERLGYMLGRFMYLCDALDDLERDRQSGAFNPLLRGNVDAAGILRMTVAECCHAYALLEPRYYRGILDNTIYLGLQNTADGLLKRRDAK